MEFTCTDGDIGAGKILCRRASFSVHGAPQNAPMRGYIPPRQPLRVNMPQTPVVSDQAWADMPGSVLEQGVLDKSEQANLANGGLHNHRSRADAQVSQPTSHTDHRALYAAVVSAISDQQGQAS